MIRCASVVLLMLLTLQVATCAQDILALLKPGARQEKLYYSEASLPDAVQQLVAGDATVREFQEAYRGTEDEMVRFNLVLIMDKKLLRGIWTVADKDAAVAFLRKCVRSAHPWIATEAVYALGNSGDRDALADVVGCLDHASATATYHAVVAYQQLSGGSPDLSPAQQRRVRAFLTAAGGADAHNALADKELAAYVARAAF